jgi:hypothetical protein
MTTSHPTRPAWVAVLDAFMAAPNRTLTNADLGAIHGVQAWHQRISDLKRYGYLFTGSKKVAQGYYAYRLLGLSASVEGTLPRADELPRLDPEQYRDAKLTAELELSALAKPTGGRLTTGDPTFAGASVTAASTATTGIRAGRHAVSEAKLNELRDALAATFQTEQADAPLSPDDILAEAVAAVGALRMLREQVEAAAKQPKPRRRAAAREPRAPRAKSGPALMIDVLTAAGGPLHARDITERVLAIDAARPEDERAYKGKTPGATMAAQLSTSHKQNGTFCRTAPNTYGLRERDAALAIDPAGVTA